MSFNFAADDKLPPAVAARMQAATDRRIAAGLESADGQVHKNAASKAAYEAGHGVLSRAYLDAAFPAKGN